MRRVAEEEFWKRKNVEEIGSEIVLRAWCDPRQGSSAMTRAKSKPKAKSKSKAKSKAADRSVRGTQTPGHSQEWRCYMNAVLQEIMLRFLFAGEEKTKMKFKIALVGKG